MLGARDLRCHVLALFCESEEELIRPERRTGPGRIVCSMKRRERKDKKEKRREGGELKNDVMMRWKYS
jgi:hypothetical protein